MCFPRAHPGFRGPRHLHVRPSNYLHEAPLDRLSLIPFPAIFCGHDAQRAHHSGPKLSARPIAVSCIVPPRFQWSVKTQKSECDDAPADTTPGSSIWNFLRTYSYSPRAHVGKSDDGQGLLVIVRWRTSQGGGCDCHPMHPTFQN